MNSVTANLLALCVALLLGIGERAAAQGPPPQAPPPQIPETWLMLKNGSTFSARMLSAGERVRLRVNDGDIEVRASEIALTGYSLSDLAEQQWATLHQQALDKQLPFIDWCARHHLYDMADSALAQIALRAQDPPRIAGYQARIKRLREIQQEQQLAAQQNATMPIAANAGPSAINTAPPAHTLTRADAVPPLVLPAPPGMNGGAKPQAEGLSQGKNDAIAENASPAFTSPNPATLSSAAVELFTARVQPWVVSRCSGCHDQQSTQPFKLERYSKQEGVTRATTLKNLAAVSRLIDQENPAASPLLVMSARAHGTSTVPPITAGDAAALTAFREFVALATGRELPKETKSAVPSASHDPTVHLTPGRATFPASAVEEPPAEDKTAALLKQTGPGWQAAIARQKAIDAEAAKLRELQTNSQRTNEARGLLVDPAVKPAAANQLPAGSDPPATTTAITPSTAPALPTTMALPPSQLGTPPLLPTASPSSASLLLAPSASTPAVVSNERSELVGNRSSTATFTDGSKANSAITDAASGPLTMLPAATGPVATPHGVPQINTLPPSLAPKAKTEPELEAALETSVPGTTIQSLKEGQPPLPNLGAAGSASAKPTPPINLNRPRKKFPLPPEETPPSKGVGTGETKRR